MLIELVDGGIKDIYTDTESYAGCETCDYGSQYINEFTVYLTKGNIQFKVEQMYDYAVSEDYLMKLFLQNVDKIKQLTEIQFYEWLKYNLEADFKDTVEEFKIDTSLQ
jgi:hypothetical protein